MSAVEIAKQDFFLEAFRQLKHDVAVTTSRFNAHNEELQKLLHPQVYDPNRFDKLQRHGDVSVMNKRAPRPRGMWANY